MTKKCQPDYRYDICFFRQLFCSLCVKRQSVLLKPWKLLFNFRVLRWAIVFYLLDKLILSDTIFICFMARWKNCFLWVIFHVYSDLVTPHTPNPVPQPTHSHSHTPRPSKMLFLWNWSEWLRKKGKKLTKSTLLSLLQIIHYELPNSSEIFVHRSGRTGRAGKKGSAILIYTNEESRAVSSIERDVNCKFTEVKYLSIFFKKK